MEQSQLEKFLGGSPKDVLFKLIIASLVVGFLLAAFGFNPYNLLYSLENLFFWIWNSGYEFIYRIWRYLLLGAAIVVPVWLLMRLLGGFSKKPLIDVKITAKTSSQVDKKGVEDLH